MGKIRIKTIGDEDAEKKQLEEQKKKKEARIEAKKAEAKAVEKSDEKPEADEKETADEAKSPEKEVKVEPSSAKATEGQGKKQAKKAKINGKQQPHSKSYASAVAAFDKSKTYALSSALETLKKLQRTKFDETVELHINLLDKGVSGQVTLPHGTGKQTRVAIADDKIIADIEAGKIEFDVLVAEPAMMPKLAKVARILGPRGLMPNPKNGTVTPKPEDVAKKYAGGQISFKTESKAPVIHLSVGKMSFGEKKLEENIKVIFGAIKKEQIANVTLKSSMSPGIKLTL